MEVEVERLPVEGGAPAGDPTPGVRLQEKRMNPVVAGLLVDLLDLATRGPRGFVIGAPLGALAGYWLGRRIGLQRGQSIGMGLLCGLYCAIPGTEMVPLGTLVGLYRLLSR